MEETKQLVKTVREQLVQISSNIDKLTAMDVEITLNVGTDKKTVTFEKISMIEFGLLANIKQTI